MIFRALETFDSPETRSTYLKGLTYTVRPGNDLLAVLATDWLERGMVERVSPDALPKLRISGSGFVKE